MRKQTTAEDGVGPPTDVGALDFVKAAINLGVKTITASHQWSWLHQTHEIALNADGDGPNNINADASRYRLPESITGIPYGDVTCRYGDAWLPVEVVARERIERLIASNVGSAGIVSTISLEHSVASGSDVGQRAAWVLQCFPEPSTDMTLKITFRVEIPEIVDDAECGVWPAAYDRMVIAAAVAELGTMGMLPDSVAASAPAVFQDLLTKAIGLDSLVGWPRGGEGDGDDQPWVKPGMRTTEGVKIW